MTRACSPKINARNKKDQFTVLHYAVYEGPVDEAAPGDRPRAGFLFRKLFVRSLLSHRADISITNAYGETAMEALKKGNLSKHPHKRDELVQILDNHLNNAGGPGEVGNDEDHFTKTAKRMVNMINTQNNSDIERIVELRRTASTDGVPVMDKLTRKRVMVKLENVRKKWSIKKIIELVWDNAMGDQSLFKSSSSGRKGQKSRTVAMQYCELFAALRDANPGFEIADYVIQTGHEMLLARVEPDLQEAAEAAGDHAVAEEKRKRELGKTVQPVVRLGVVNVFKGEARAKTANLCKFAALLVLRDFLPLHAVIRGVFAPLLLELAKLQEEGKGRPQNALLCADALVDTLEMLQGFKNDAKFLPVLLKASLLLQASLAPMIGPDKELAGEVGRLAHTFQELMGKLFAWSTGKKKGQSRNAAEMSSFSRGPRLMRRGGGGGGGGGGSRGRFGSGGGSGDVRAYRPPGGGNARRESAEEPPSPSTPGVVGTRAMVHEAQQWAPRESSPNPRPFYLHQLLQSFEAVEGVPAVSCTMDVRLAILVALTTLQAIEDVVECKELQTVLDAADTDDKKTWIIVQVLAYGSMWLKTDTRVLSKLACVLQQIARHCTPELYAKACSLATAHKFPHTRQKESAAAIVELAKSGDFQKKINEMFDNTARRQLRQVFRSLGDTVSALDFVPKCTSAVGEPSSLSNKKMSALVYELLQFLVMSPSYDFHRLYVPVQNALEHLLHSEAIDTDMIVTANDNIHIDTKENGDDNPSEEALDLVKVAVEQAQKVRGMVKELTLTDSQRAVIALKAFFASGSPTVDYNVAVLRACVNAISKSHQGRSKPEAARAMAELLVREALAQMTDPTQCCALVNAIKSDEELRSQVPLKSFETAVETVGEDLGVIKQVNPAAETMLRYLRDPSAVEADARAAELEAAKAKRIAWTGRVDSLGRLSRSQKNGDVENFTNEQQAIVDEIEAGFRAHPEVDRGNLALDLMCAAIENLNLPEVQGHFFKFVEAAVSVAVHELFHPRHRARVTLTCCQSCVPLLCSFAPPGQGRSLRHQPDSGRRQYLDFGRYVS